VLPRPTVILELMAVSSAICFTTKQTALDNMFVIGLCVPGTCTVSSQTASKLSPRPQHDHCACHYFSSGSTQMKRPAPTKVLFHVHSLFMHYFPPKDIWRVFLVSITRMFPQPPIISLKPSWAGGFSEEAFLASVQHTPQGRYLYSTHVDSRASAYT
jgi:hypothetical protein